MDSGDPAARNDLPLVEALKAYDALPMSEKTTITHQSPAYCYAKGWIAALNVAQAAHRAEVERAVREAVEQEREAIAAWHDAEADRIRQEIATSLQIMRENASAFVGLNTSMDHEYAQAETHRECAAAIRARGAKS